MIIEVDGRRVLAVGQDDESAQYDCSRTLIGATAPTMSHVDAQPVRMMVEIRRNLGGMIMRAKLGGEFRPGGDQTQYEVCVSSLQFDSGMAADCSSDLGGSLVPGLPSDFAAATLDGLTSQAPKVPLPAGLLRLDRAGYDVVGSSDAAFGLAARMLRYAVSLTLAGADLEPELRAAFANDRD